MTRWRLVLAAIASLAIAGAAFAHLALAKSRFLRDRDGARWLVADTVPWPATFPIAPRLVSYRTSFHSGSAIGFVELELRAVERASVELDGETVYTDAEPDPLGHIVRRIPLGALREGEHELVIDVFASASPPLVWARSEPPILATGAGWESIVGGPGGKRRAVRFATDPPEPLPLSRQFPHVGRAFVRVLPALVPLFLAALWVAWRGRPQPKPQQLRWALIVFWIGLAANNLFRVRAALGMDLGAHVAYALHLLRYGSIPLATQGGEMMQAPLAYLLFAPLIAVFRNFFEAEGIVQALRIVPMACGALQVELCYRAVRRVHPDHPDRQRVGILVGGLLPMNLYLAHAVANEPVVAVFGGATAVAALRVIGREQPPSAREAVVAGALLGLALLSKMTAVLLAPPLVAAVALRSLGADRGVARAALQVARVAGVAGLLAGWYYARNWIQLGTPFLGTWSPLIPDPWWQEPGYRSAVQYLRFGEALAHPILAARVGLWDGLYSTFWLDGWVSSAALREYVPWNVPPLLAGAWLALVPSAAIAAGVVRSLRRTGTRRGERHAERLAAGTVALYLTAILYLHLIAPFYCAAKASYAAAATPLFGVLAASGYAELAGVRWVRAVIAAALVCWAANVVATYWVI
jgi:Dolichyl-phosphate-mannose-protein mannosyltransferase